MHVIKYVDVGRSWKEFHFLAPGKAKKKHAEQFCVLEKWAPDEFKDQVVLNKAVDLLNVAAGFVKQVTKKQWLRLSEKQKINFRSSLCCGGLYSFRTRQGAKP